MSIPRPLTIAIQACVAPIDVPGVPTIAGVANVKLLESPSLDSIITVETPRGALGVGAAFTIRYLARDGAKRGLFRCLSVEPCPGMKDQAVVQRLADVAAAREREEFRVPLRQPATARRLADGERALRLGITLVDLARAGIGFESASPLVAGDKLLIETPTVPPTLFEVVRVVRGRPARYGALAPDKEAGAQFQRSLLTSIQDEAERVRAERRRRDELARRLENVATGTREAEQTRGRGIYTRPDRGGSA
jgi:hypothetical protein